MDISTDEREIISFKVPNFVHVFGRSILHYLNSQKFCDATLECHGVVLQCHRIVLGIFSPYLERLFDSTPPVDDNILRVALSSEIDLRSMQILFDYMYKGYASVLITELDSFRNVVRLLEIRGLVDTIGRFSVQELATDIPVPPQMCRRIFPNDMNTKSMPSPSDTSNTDQTQLNKVSENEKTNKENQTQGDYPLLPKNDQDHPVVSPESLASCNNESRKRSRIPLAILQNAAALVLQGESYRVAAARTNISPASIRLFLKRNNMIPLSRAARRVTKLHSI